MSSSFAFNAPLINHRAQYKEYETYLRTELKVDVKKVYPLLYGHEEWVVSYLKYLENREIKKSNQRSKAGATGIAPGTFRKYVDLLSSFGELYETCDKRAAHQTPAIPLVTAGWLLNIPDIKATRDRVLTSLHRQQRATMDTAKTHGALDRAVPFGAVQDATSALIAEGSLESLRVGAEVAFLNTVAVRGHVVRDATLLDLMVVGLGRDGDVPVLALQYVTVSLHRLSSPSPPSLCLCLYAYMYTRWR